LGGIGKFSIPDPENEEYRIYLPYDTGIPAWLPKDKDYKERFTDIEITPGFSDRILQQIKDGISF
jgi:hypothetical protein